MKPVRTFYGVYFSTGTSALKFLGRRAAQYRVAYTGTRRRVDPVAQPDRTAPGMNVPPSGHHSSPMGPTKVALGSGKQISERNLLSKFVYVIHGPTGTLL